MNSLQPTSQGVLGFFFILLSFLYGIAVRLRLFLYSTGILRTKKVEGIKTISIGNLTVGGTGKTPVTMLVARMAGNGCAIVSRGYGRRSQEPAQVVADGKKFLAEYPAAADEALMCALELKTVPVICAPCRVEGIRVAARQFNAKTVILDDAFSHLAAYRDKNILLVDAHDPFGGDHLLPAGRLREPLSSVRRADAVVITRANQVNAGRLEGIRQKLGPRLKNGTPIFSCDIIADSIIDPSGQKHPARDFLAGKNVRLVSGIASPTQFESTISSLGANVLSHDEFPDHHPFSLGDIARVTGQVHAGEVLLTTQKDLVRVPQNSRGGFHALSISAQMREEDAFKRWLAA